MSSSELTTVSKVLKGGSWLYLSSIFTNFFGFIYWFAISVIGGPSVLGYTSAIIGLASLINGVLGLGSGIGLQKFVGNCWSRGDRKGLATYFWSTIIFSALIYSIVSLAMILIALSGFSYSKFSPEALIVCSLLVALGFNVNFTALFTAVLKTNIVALVTIAGNIARLCIGIPLVALGWGWIGASLGYVSHYFIAIVLYLFYSRKYAEKKLVFSTRALFNVLKAGVVSWLPRVVMILGQWLGVLVVFGSASAVETGAYYVAFMISSVVVGFGTSITTLLLPVLSGLADGRKRVCWNTLKISYAAILPLVLTLIIYPWLPLKLLREEYIAASNSLVVLLISSLLVIFITAVTNLLYAYNGYLKIFTIGAASNIPRIFSYFILVPLYKGYGAALSFLIGSIVGFISSAVVSKSIDFHPSYRVILLLSAIPAALSSIVWFLFPMQWIIGIPLVVILSYLAYIKLGLVSKQETEVILCTLLPSFILNKIKITASSSIKKP
ncbi:MAG: hypothetical protein DRJ52_09105 [Thermoprotei archaeon]|nr:MAG: hypothetical protein DRJ52_09105 [Thermoprotei archaeon]RLE98044.1 MAG: hypothetical protein DRJ63_08295 [Thermoprotei archaeon]